MQFNTENIEIRALSLKEPYASLMLHGKIETRTWNTNYRGYVLICASKQPYSDQSIKTISGLEVYDKIYFHVLDYFMENCIRDHVGEAIAIGRLVNCRPMLPIDEDKCFVKYQEGLFCHVYEDVQAIEPFPWKGCQGWKKLTPEQKQLIKVLPQTGLI